MIPNVLFSSPSWHITPTPPGLSAALQPGSFLAIRDPAAARPPSVLWSGPAPPSHRAIVWLSSNAIRVNEGAFGGDRGDTRSDRR